MNTSQLRKRLLASSVAVPAFALLSAGFAMPAYAQEETDAENTQEEQVILVTGSRIQRPNLESNIPITTLSSDDIFLQGQTNIGDTLNDLPQLRSTFAQQNPGAGVGITGLNLLDLRGLGTVRTLVLVNGRRHVPADILNNAASPDVNTIPIDLVERVEIVTGGNSAVYGSDAIAGVVNFILRRDFEGIQLRASSAVSEPGFGANQYVSAMFGQNFAGGRGNITLHGEYAHQERVYASDVPWFRQADGFVAVDADSPGLPSGSDGFPDSMFLRDIRSATIHRYGLAAVPQAAGSAACGVGTLANNGGPNNLGTPYHCNYIFTPEGRLTPQTGTRVGTGPAGTFLGGNGQNTREGTQLSILPFTERFNVNLLAHYEFSPAAEAFLEAKFARVNAIGNQLGPTFLNNSTGSLGSDSRIAPRLDNPYLNPDDRAVLTNAILNSGCGFTIGQSIGSATCRPLTAAEQTAIANGTYRFLFARNLTDLPDRDEVFERDTIRVVAGLRGQFNDDWSYEVSANYGKFEETTQMQGFVNRQRFLLSLDAGWNPATNSIECRSQFDPTAAVGHPGYVNSAATLAADIAACEPYNVFGADPRNAAAINYFMLPITNRSSIEQLDFQAFVSGDSSQWFELPGGPIGFAVGAQYRREKAFNDSDEAAETGISNSVFLGDVDAPAMEVKEVFGELNVPILNGTPFFEDLSLHGAARLSDYNTAVGTIVSYNGGIEWAPISDIRFRANYGRAVRAPNASESLFPAVDNFANNFIDPCNVNAIGNNPIRSANCQAQLSAAQLAALPQAGYSLGIVSGSNPNLAEETSESWTLGAVITPRFLPGFSLTADYYNITVDDVIVTLAAQTIVNSCYDSEGLSSPLCNVFQRNLTGATGPFGEAPGQILFYTLVAGPQNFARRVREGIDVEALYRTNLTDDIGLSTRFIYSHQLKNSNYEDPARPNFENRLLDEIGDPQDEFRWNVDVEYGQFRLGYIMRYIGPMLTTTYENLFPLNNQAALNSDAFDIINYPSMMYHNVRFEYDIEDPKIGGNATVYAGIDNLTNQKPPLGTTATGVGTAIYNVRGRVFFVGTRATF